MNIQISTRAVVCTAHLLLMQNPHAHLNTDDWVNYLTLIRDWCSDKVYYFEVDLEGTHQPCN